MFRLWNKWGVEEYFGVHTSWTALLLLDPGINIPHEDVVVRDDGRVDGKA